MTLAELKEALLTPEEVKRLGVFLNSRNSLDGWGKDMLDRISQWPETIQNHDNEKGTPEQQKQLLTHLNLRRPTETELSKMECFKDEPGDIGEWVRKLLSISKPDFS